MAEKTYNESETLAEQESSVDVDAGPDEKVSEVETESDTLTGQTGPTASNEANDDLETARSPDEAHKEAGRESEESGTDNDNETSQSESSDGDDAEAPEKEAQSGNEENDQDDKGANTEEEATEKVSDSDTADTDEIAEIKGSSEERTATEEIVEKLETKDNVIGDDPAAQVQNEPETNDADEESGDLAEGKTSEPPAKKNSVLKVTAAVIIIAAAFYGFFLFDNKSKIKTASEKSSNTSQKREISLSRLEKSKMIKPIIAKASSIYSTKIEEITALRDSLLHKQEEVTRLKKHYQDGIEELQKEISDELQKGEANTFLQAMGNDAIAFSLKTIQRRQAYIHQLEKPSRWIYQAREELLYIKRRTIIDIQVAEIAGGIDLNEHMRHINAAIRKYQPAADKLAPDMTNAQLEPLEIIWERIQNKTQLYVSVRSHSKNQIISEQICTGNFDHLTELSEISAETARCITELKGSDLFLNSVAEISPGAAKQLIQWKGSWVCLNGVRALSPRAAHYLFQWDGNWISLNGLTEFPVEIGETLLQWDGHQLELMGLQYVEDFPTRIALDYLARWERSGGKLFVPEDVRKKIDEMQGEST